MWCVWSACEGPYITVKSSPQLQQREAAALTSQLRKVPEVLLFHSLQMAMKDSLEEIWGGAGPKSTLTCKISRPCVWFLSSVWHRIRVWVLWGSRWWVFSAQLSRNSSFCHSIDDRFCVYYLWQGGRGGVSAGHRHWNTEANNTLWLWFFLCKQVSVLVMTFKQCVQLLDLFKGAIWKIFSCEEVIMQTSGDHAMWVQSSFTSCVKQGHYIQI